MSDVTPKFTSPGLAASEAMEAAWIARDICIVLGQALAPHEETFGPVLLDALRTVAGLGEEHASRALEAASAACGLTHRRGGARG